MVSDVNCFRPPYDVSTLRTSSVQETDTILVVACSVVKGTDQFVVGQGNLPDVQPSESIHRVVTLRELEPDDLHVPTRFVVVEKGQVNIFEKGFIRRAARLESDLKPVLPRIATISLRNVRTIYGGQSLLPVNHFKRAVRERLDDQRL